MQRIGRRSFLKKSATVLPVLAVIGLAGAASARPVASASCEGCAEACFSTCKDGCDTTCKGNCSGDCTGSTK
jgi:CXXX repeat radical SAM target protein